MSRSKPGAALDLAGKRFGLLTAVRFLRSGGIGSFQGRVWLTACACGAEREVAAQALNSGAVRACKACTPTRGHQRRHFPDGSKA